jgi:hypothetical protein
MSGRSAATDSIPPPRGEVRRRSCDAGVGACCGMMVGTLRFAHPTVITAGMTKRRVLLPWLRLRIMFRGRVKPAQWQVIDASDARRDGIWCRHGFPGRDLPRAHLPHRTPP